ncbi:hypothetical protein BDY17DRAFT_79036 [Neohortaea acidophila]|uniref:Uncharacterized protein n=1 Tax=Neohortaea acidophila TaxID=245834 RepID=A0A6A6Q4V2_9PEZI|nr:uncharacterized protein BDY17DRAFT_79036 [Neohortaea acidophila]KAF2486437.1 hypothetical protein BDY17DRAFT_79036 [Neohortaea acidophila]
MVLLCDGGEEKAEGGGGGGGAGEGVVIRSAQPRRVGGASCDWPRHSTSFRPAPAAICTHEAVLVADSQHSLALVHSPTLRQRPRGGSGQHVLSALTCRWTAVSRRRIPSHALHFIRPSDLPRAKAICHHMHHLGSRPGQTRAVCESARPLFRAIFKPLIPPARVASPCLLLGPHQLCHHCDQPRFRPNAPSP